VCMYGCKWEHKRRKKEREREKENILGYQPASQPASPGQHRPGIVASALAPLLSRTINLASIPDRPFSVSPSTSVCVYMYVYVCVCVRARGCMQGLRILAHGSRVSSLVKARCYVPDDRATTNQWTSRFLVFADSYFLRDRWSSKKAETRYRENDRFPEAIFSGLSVALVRFCYNSTLSTK
jgi:hypothetical protein